MLSRRGVLKGVTLMAATSSVNCVDDDAIEHIIDKLRAELVKKYGGEWSSQFNESTKSVFIVQVLDGPLIRKSTKD